MQATLSLSLLGTFRVERNGEPVVAFESNKVRALLVYLAVEAGRAHQRSALAGMLWLEHSEELARTNLRHVLRQLRQTLPDQQGIPPLFLTSQQTIQLNSAHAFALDVNEFAELLAASTRCNHYQFSECADCIERYICAATLYRGPFLEGFALYDSGVFDEWAATIRENLHQQALEVCFMLAAHYLQTTDYGIARQYAWRQIELEPWREEAHRQLMRVLALSGQRTAALAQFVRCRTILAEELGVEPDAETLALYEAIRTSQPITGSLQGAHTTAKKAVTLQSSASSSLLVPSTAKPPKSTSHSLAVTRRRMVGRQREQAQLEQLWSVTQGGQGRLALVAGEPGIGKTRLTQALVDHVQQQGAIILRGGCYEFEATTAYLPFVEALRAYVHAHDADTLRAQLGSTATELARLVPEIEVKLGTLAASVSLAPSDERLRLFDNVARFLQSLASERGLLICFDDLHWADRSTLGLLHYVLRHLRDHRLMVIAAYRETELVSDHPLIDALDDWNRERFTMRIALERLNQLETGELLADLLKQSQPVPAFSEMIYRETEGNPFFVEEVVKAVIAQEQVNRPIDLHLFLGNNKLEIPQTIKEAIGRRLRRLSNDCNEMLHTAAALGKTFEFTELASVGLGGEDRLLDTIDEACFAQIIRPSQGDSFTFTHDKLRETIYHKLNAIRQRRLHQRIAEGLERLYTIGYRGVVPFHVLAFHAVAGHDWQRGLFYALRAAEQARRVFANDEALYYYQLARQCAEALNQPDQIAAVAELAGDVYVVRGPLQLAVEHYQHTYELLALPSARAALKVKIGRAYVSAGDARALTFLSSALDELDRVTQAREMAAALAALGRLHHYWCQHEQAIMFLERARVLAEPLDDLYVWVDIFSHLAGACQHMGRVTQSMEWARQSIALAERYGEPQAAGASYDYLAQGAALLGQWAASIDYSVRGQQIAEETGDLVGLAWIAFDRAWSLHGQGRLQEAQAAAHEAMKHGEELGEQRLVAWAAGILVVAQTDLQLDPLSIAQQNIIQADQLGQPALRSNSRRSLAYLHVQRQEWQQAATLLEQATAILVDTDNRCEQLWYLGANRAEAYLGLGRLEEAFECITVYLALARQSESRYFEGLALRVQAQILAAQHDYAAAQRTVDQAVATLEAVGTSLELGRALYQRALMVRPEYIEAARIDLQQACDLFAACGALRDLKRAEALLTL